MILENLLCGVADIAKRPNDSLWWTYLVLEVSDGSKKYLNAGRKMQTNLCKRKNILIKQTN
jgi:hypothetical protein